MGHVLGAELGHARADRAVEAGGDGAERLGEVGHRLGLLGRGVVVSDRRRSGRGGRRGDAGDAGPRRCGRGGRRRRPRRASTPRPGASGTASAPSTMASGAERRRRRRTPAHDGGHRERVLDRPDVGRSTRRRAGWRPARSARRRRAARRGRRSTRAVVGHPPRLADATARRGVGLQHARLAAGQHLERVDVAVEVLAVGDRRPASAATSCSMPAALVLRQRLLEPHHAEVVRARRRPASAVGSVKISLPSTISSTRVGIEVARGRRASRGRRATRARRAP